ncbi:M20 family metallopeptidase [Maricurvus nonylphenolicus]|uniref:M20/M25/M40 family metallo-hydrolase n=1 Tax=Maricurvus nonylphenolicus TaxID=1008307 RepID=UPI0036F31114
MSDDKQILLKWIEEDRDRLVTFFSDFIRAKSPNPPGDTVHAAETAEKVLKQEGLDYERIAPQANMPNIIASFGGEAGDGKHLVLNGHIDVFPASGDKTPEGRDAFSGDVEDGWVYGRGASDMKAGTTASLFTYIYLNRLRDRLKGRLSLTMVSDEETLGPWGAQYLLENHPDAPGDCCLNGEPSSAQTILFSERGFLWLEFTVKTDGAHGSFGHTPYKNAVKLSTKIFEELEELTNLQVEVPAEIADGVQESKAILTQFSGEDAAERIGKVQLSIGRIEGGTKVNMMPSKCVFEADFRIPLGLTKAELLAKVHEIVEKYPQLSVKEINGADPSWSDPNDEMIDIIRSNVRELRGFEPARMVSLGATDCRLWRFRDIPAFCYGPSPSTMATVDEKLEIEDFLHTVRSHVLSAYDYLTADRS